MFTPIKVLVIGAEGTGKSLLIKELNCMSSSDIQTNHDSIPSTVPTVGSNIVNISMKNLQVELREIGGSMAPIWKNYYEDANAIIFVIDKSNHFQNSASCMLLLSALSNSKIDGKPVLILLNNSDWQCNILSSELRNILRIDDIIKTSNCDLVFQECSCVSRHGLTDVIKWLEALK